MTTPAADGPKINKYDGDGQPYKGKLIGMEDLKVDRDERICLDSMFKLKAVASARGEHKQRIQLNLTSSGIKVYDDTSKVLLASHEVERISFVVLDPRDTRAFGYIYNTSDDRHQFWAIKSEKNATLTVLALKELFEIAFEEFTKKEKAKANGGQPTTPPQLPAVTQVSSLLPASVPPTPPAPQQPVVPATPAIEDLWGPSPAPTNFPPVQPSQPTNTPDLWSAPASASPAPPPQDPLAEMFASLAPSPPPVPSPPTMPTLPPPRPAAPTMQTMTTLPRPPVVPTMPPQPTVPILATITPPAPATVDNNDLFSMFAPVAPTPPVNNAMFAQPTLQTPIIPPPQPNLLAATPAPAVAPPTAAKPLAEFDLLGDFA